MAITIIYLILVLIIGIFVVWRIIETDSVYEKITGAVMLVLLILRYFMIK